MAAKKFRLSFYGAAGEVSGSNFLIEETSGRPAQKILIDCGLFQGSKFSDDRNREPFPYEPASIDCLVVTHPHIDHTGRIPKLVREGFKGRIISTPPCREISELMLLDSLGVLSKQSQAEGRPLLYEEKDVEAALSLWQTASYGETIRLGDLEARFLGSGHTLGSAMVEFKLGQSKLVFSGDLGNAPAPLLPDAEVTGDANYLVVESVYGDRRHEDRARRKQILEDVVEETIQGGGTLLVPAFSLERTQELLYEIQNLMESNRIPLVPVFLDSPLAIKITGLYKKYQDYLRPEARGRELFQFPQLHFTAETSQSRNINLRFRNIPKVIMAGAGMSNGGRIIHHEKEYLSDPKSTLLLASYQAPGTLGRRLADGAKEVEILGEQVPVRARIVSINGYSGHRDMEGLLEFVAQSADSLKRVFVVMGEPKASLFLVQRIKDYLGIRAYAPGVGETVELEL